MDKRLIIPGILGIVFLAYDIWLIIDGQFQPNILGAPGYGREGAFPDLTGANHQVEQSKWVGGHFVYFTVGNLVIIEIAQEADLNAQRLIG